MEKERERDKRSALQPKWATACPRELEVVMLRMLTLPAHWLGCGAFSCEIDNLPPELTASSGASTPSTASTAAAINNGKIQKKTTTSSPGGETLGKERSESERHDTERTRSKTVAPKNQLVRRTRQQYSHQLKCAEVKARARAASLLQPLNTGELDVINTQLHGRQGEPEETIVKQNGTDVVTLKSFRTLRPGTWLSDETIHYYFRLLQQRDDELCKTHPTRAKCHFFKSFFMTKLNNEGHLERDGEYEYSNVKRWARSE
jgi:hypothetical protein